MSINWRKFVVQLLNGLLLLTFYCAGYFTSYFDSQIKVNLQSERLEILEAETLSQQTEIDDLKARASRHTESIKKINELIEHVEELSKKINRMERNN